MLLIFKMKSIVLLCFVFAAVHASVPGRRIHRITGGQLAKEKQFPYQAKLEVLKFKNGIVVSATCGGALISNRTILTAGHCLESGFEAHVFLGQTLSPLEETRVMREVQNNGDNFKIHENYNDDTLENDVGLLTFSPAVEFSDGVKTIDLPQSDQANYEGRTGVIAGFGRTGENAPLSYELRFANRDVVPKRVCEDFFEEKFHPDMQICIEGSNNISACDGDSGGALVIQESDGSKIAVGLASFGGEACDKGYPGIFTKVTNYLSWIKKNAI